MADYPIVLYPAEHAKINILNKHKCAFSLTQEKEEATLLFPLAGKLGNVTIHLSGKGKSILKETTMTPDMGEEIELESNDCICRLYVPTYEVTSKRATRNLSKKEEEKLRTLGYIE